MKKLLIGILVVGSLFSFAGCGNKETTDDVTDNKTTVEDSTNKSTTDESSKETTNTIDLEEAKNIALKDAGFAANEVTFSRTEVDTDASEQKYEIEFTHNGEEYDYEVDFNGKILKSGKEKA